MASVSLPLSGSTIVGSVVVLSAPPAPPQHGTSCDGGRDEHAPVVMVDGTNMAPVVMVDGTNMVPVVMVDGGCAGKDHECK